MAFTWPRFEEPIPLTEGTSWTALFESYDQRNEVCYYVVSLHASGREPRRIMAQVDTGWAGDDWSTPEFAARIQRVIDWIARQGRSNTQYLGPLGR
mgnify:FL=1